MGCGIIPLIPPPREGCPFILLLPPINILTPIPGI
jgi:hypothetical protein